jgi:hypothetical protein
VTAVIAFVRMAMSPINPGNDAGSALESDASA